MSRLKRLRYNERQYIESQLKDEMPVRFIASQLKRATSSIFYEVKKNGGREKYEANSAQQYADRNAAAPSPKQEREKIKQRIDMIEMQLDILVYTIKELKGTHDSKDKKL